VQPGIDLIKANQFEIAHGLFVTVIESLINRGASAIILGCTEIPLVVKETQYHSISLINSIDSLVKSTINKFKG